MLTPLLRHAQFLPAAVLPAVETIPWWLQLFVSVNPITHLVTAIRGLMHGTATSGQIGTVLLISVLFVAIFGPVTMYLFRNKNNR
jgi:ABC-2 type transport system permease protein